MKNFLQFLKLFSDAADVKKQVYPNFQSYFITLRLLRPVSAKLGHKSTETLRIDQNYIFEEVKPEVQLPIEYI